MMSEAGDAVSSLRTAGFSTTATGFLRIRSTDAMTQSSSPSGPAYIGVFHDSNRISQNPLNRPATDAMTQSSSNRSIARSLNLELSRFFFVLHY
jgi:hypothetical protein